VQTALRPYRESIAGQTRECFGKVNVANLT
jgi:hypothetical protein